MKKKILSLLATTILVLSFTSCATAPDIKSGEVKNINVDTDEYAVTYDSFEITKSDYDGSPAIIIYLNYTNKVDETRYAGDVCIPQLFQDNIELDEYDIIGENKYMYNAQREIGKGKTLKIGYAFGLDDTTTPVSFKLTPIFDGDRFEDVYQEQIINIK